MPRVLLACPCRESLFKQRGMGQLRTSPHFDNAFGEPSDHKLSAVRRHSETESSPKKTCCIASIPTTWKVFMDACRLMTSPTSRYNTPGLTAGHKGNAAAESPTGRIESNQPFSAEQSQDAQAHHLGQVHPATSNKASRGSPSLSAERIETCGVPGHSLRSPSVVRTYIDSFLHALVSGLHQPSRHVVHLADEEGLIEVPMIAVQKHRHIHVHDVALHKWPCVGDAVADHLVYGPETK